MKIRILIFILLSTLFAGSLSAESQDYRFRTFSPDGGFYYDGVKSITQDKKGFVWVMMDYELLRFDGYKYKRYYHKFPEWEQSQDWVFNDMLVDSHNRLFVATNDGLYQYKENTDSFEMIIEGSAFYLEKDGLENVWVRIGQNIGILELDKKTINYPLLNGEVPDFLRSIHTTRNKETYILSNYGLLLQFDYENNEFIQSHSGTLPFENIGLIKDAHIHKGKLWAAVADKGLYVLNLANLELEEHYGLDKMNNSTIRTLHIDKNGFVWIGTILGVYILDPNTKELKHYQHNPDNEFSLPNNSVWTITQDLQENIWIGTFSGGLVYVNLDEGVPFKSYKLSDRKIKNSPISSFAENKDNLWVGTEGGGFIRVNKNTREKRNYTSNGKANSLAYNNVKALLLDKKDNLWIGTYSGGLDYFDTKTERFINYKYSSENPDNSLIANSIRAIQQEADSGIWIAYQNRDLQISYLSNKDKNITHHILDSEQRTQYIFDMLRGRDNKLWILSRQSLFVMDVKTQQTERLIFGESKSLNGQTLCLDDAGNIWIGTIGKGLIKYDSHTANFTAYTDILNEDASSIFSILYDDNGSLWLGTDNGLYKYDIANNQYSRYDKNDGILKDVFWPLARYKGIDGYIYFGGTGGFTSVNTNKITSNKYQPNIIISDFLVDNEAILSLDNVKQGCKIVLDYDQVDFSLLFSSDNYLMPQKNRFKYKLEGYDRNWIYTDASDRSADYSKVPAGKYKFSILAANNDGLWSKMPTTTEIIRKPAPWLSWYAYLIYTVIALLIVYSIYYYYRKQEKLKLELYLDTLEKNKQKEINESQLRFVTNISHDFRTPLSLIMGVVDRLRKQGLRESDYRILNGNSKRLLNLVNELMDFRTIENGKMNLEVEKTDVNAYLKEIASSFSDYAKQHDQSYTVNLDRTLSSPVYIDKYVIEKVIMNLLNNAFKYTPKGGNISIETYHPNTKFESQYENYHTEGVTNPDEQYFSIVVRDTGVGISKESITNVFERYYKVKTVNFDSHLGTGIGLALAKNLTKLHKGSITIYSERDKGTDFILQFPFNHNYQAEEIKQDSKPASGAETAINTREYELPEDDRTEGIVQDAKRRVLLVEDNDDLRFLLKDALAEDYDIVEAGDGMEASEIIDKMNINLIISDIMMPIKDGIALCAEVKSDISTSHIPFIMLSAKTSVESKIEGADSGADMYFEKPIDTDLLKKSIENIFKQQEQLREYYAKNHFAESSELSMNEKDNEFLKNLVSIIEKNMDDSKLEVSYIASELMMSRSKLYNKIKAMTGKSVVEFILSYRLRKAARLIIEEDITMREVITHIGIESQPYFTNAFKKEFGETPTAFAAKHKK